MSHTSEWTAGFTQHTMDMPQTFFMFIVPARVWEHDIESERVKERQSCCYLVVIWQMFALVPKGTWYFYVLGRQDAAFYSVCLGNKLSWQRFQSSDETDESWSSSWDFRKTRQTSLEAFWWWLFVYVHFCPMFLCCISYPSFRMFCLSSDEI